MIQVQTMLRVSDNSGAKIVKCIKVLGGFKKKYARLGDVIIVAVQELRNKSKITSKIKKGEVYKALIVSTKSTCKKKDGSIFDFNSGKNAVVLMNKKGSPIATRITQPIPFILKKKRLSKFVSLSPGLI
jgi:large subunit ribosomal protein L14